MPNKSTVAEYFVENHPQSAARILEEIAAPDASKFIDVVSDAQSSRLLAAMLPHHAARCVTYLSDSTAAKYLGKMDPRAVATILRHVPSAQANAILDKMPRAVGVRVSIVMNYSLSMVGAWVEPAVFALPENCSAGDGQMRFRQESGFGFHRVFVITSDQRLRGFVRLAALLDAPAESSILSILETEFHVLKASTSLDVAIGDPGWETNDYLPVVDRRNKFLGLLRFAALRAAISKPPTQASDGDIPGTFMDLAETCYFGLADVMSSTLAADGLSRTDSGKGR